MRRKSFPDDPADLRLPIKIDETTNGEYEPRPLSPAMVRVRQLSIERIEANARRVGMSRRDFVRSTCGAATVLLTIGEVTGCGGSVQLPKEAALEPAAAKPLEKGPDDFVFDVQTHHVSTERRWWDAERATLGDFLATGTPRSSCGRSHWTECFARDMYLKDVFLDSDTDLAVMSALWGTDDINAILVEEMAATRDRIDKAGRGRLRIHGPVLPESTPPAELGPRMKQMAERWGISAWKLYPVWSPDAKGWRLDDPATGLRVVEEGLGLGIPLFAVHKGLPLPGENATAFTSAIDVGPAARAAPQATFLIYHSGYDPGHREGPLDPRSERGVDALINGMRAAGVGKDGNVYAELGSIWRELMKDPEQAGHALGKMLLHLGEDRILWGTDAIWYGSPQDQIQALRAFQIAPELRERHGYPELTPAIKAKIFGLNAARVYGVDVEEIRRSQARDDVAKARAEYANDPAPSFTTNGPRTRRELMRLLATER